MLLIGGRAKRHVMHAADARLPARRVRARIQMHLGPWPAGANLKDRHRALVELIRPRLPKAHCLCQEFSAGHKLPDHQPNGVQAANPHCHRHRTFLPGFARQPPAIVDQLKLLALRMLHMDRALAERHYAVHRDKPFFKDLVDYIISTPIVAAVFEGRGAVERIRELMGATDPAKAAAGTIRKDFGLDVQRNATHASDSPENAVKEIEIFFSEKEIFG